MAHDDEDHITEEDLWDLLPGSAGNDRADILYKISAHLYTRNKYSEALACAQESVEILERIDTKDREALGRARSGVAHNLKAIGQNQEALTELMVVSDLYHRESLPDVAEIDCMIGRWAYDAKDFNTAAKYLSYSSSEAGDGVGDRHIAAQDRFYLGRSLLSIGNPAEALIEMTEARAAFKDLKSVFDLAIVDAGLAESFIALSRIPEAHRHAQRALDVFTTLGKRLHSTLAILPLAQALFHEGELDEALRNINEAIEIEQTSDEPDIEEIVRYEVILRDIVNALGEADVAAEITRRHESIREISDL